MADRAVIFIDGNNWYHGLGNIAVADRGRLDYRKISEKLVGPRTWTETRYYIGQINQKDSPSLYAQQRSFLTALANTDSRISIHLGRIEPHAASSEAAADLDRYLAKAKERIDPAVFADLNTIAKRHSKTTVFVEKAADVSSLWIS